MALISAGKQLLVDRGLDTGLGLVSLNDAVMQSGVARASAYRAFGDEEMDPQVAFRTDLLISYINEDPLEIRRRSAEQITAEALVLLESDDPVELAMTLRETLRLAYAGDVAGYAEDPNWRVVGPSWAATAVNQWAPTELVDAHRAGNLKAARYFLPLYQHVSEVAGMRLRPEFTWDMFGLLVNSALIGASFHAKYHPELQAVMRPTGPGGAEQPWTQAALTIEGLTLTLFEADPKADVSADLSSWIR
ncbi:MAG: hypothetical protein ACRBK7_01155 [Acidimicrobiales bacterium]